MNKLAEAYAAREAARRRALEDVSSAGLSHRLRDQVAPLLLFGLGPVAWWVAMLMAGFTTETIIALAVLVVVQVMFFLPGLFVVMVQVAKWFEHDLGKLLTVVLKLAAITIGPAALADVLFAATMVTMDFDWWGIVAGFAFYLLTAGITTACLFGLGLIDTVVAVIGIVVPRVAIVYGLGATMPWLFP